MSTKLCLVLTVLAAVAAVSSADIFGDLIGGWDVLSAFTGGATKEGKNRPAAGQREDEEIGRGCQCEGMGCNCCVDFNLTSIIDLGGPGCVRMRYISKEEGVKLNVSYGDSLLHSQTVTQKDKKGSCMDLLSELAQICARFTELKSTDDGLEGCLNFEPHVLGEVTSQYPVGCFKMGPTGMVQDQSLAPQEAEEQEKPSEASTPESEDEESSSILDVVNQSAEQGIAFISDLFGFKVPGKKTKPVAEKVTTEAASAVAEEADDDEEQDESEDAQEETSRKLTGSMWTRAHRQKLSNDV